MIKLWSEMDKTCWDDEEISFTENKIGGNTFLIPESLLKQIRYDSEKKSRFRELTKCMTLLKKYPLAYDILKERYSKLDKKGK